jgi:hypothetical protein
MTALVADSQRPKTGPLFNERARKIAKGGGLNPSSFGPAVMEGAGAEPDRAALEFCHANTTN